MIRASVFQPQAGHVQSRWERQSLSLGSLSTREPWALFLGFLSLLVREPSAPTRGALSGGGSLGVAGFFILPSLCLPDCSSVRAELSVG